MVSFRKKFTAELLGTFFLVLFGTSAAFITLTVVYGSSTPNPFNIGVTMTDWLFINLVFGMTIAIGIHSFARISGAHFNPAVTLAL